MDSYLAPAAAFGALLRDNRDAAQFYDSCTPAQKQALLLQLPHVQDMEAFIRNLPSAVL